MNGFIKFTVAFLSMQFSSQVSRNIGWIISTPDPFRDKLCPVMKVDIIMGDTKTRAMQAKANISFHSGKYFLRDAIMSSEIFRRKKDLYPSPVSDHSVS